MDSAPIGRHAALLTEFRRAFRSGPADGGLLAIEGPRLIGEALRSGYRIQKILFSQTGREHHGDKILPQVSKHAAASLATDKDFAAAMDSEHPQGVAALMTYAPAGLEQAFGKDGEVPLVVVAAGLQDPGNLGTLIRAADAFGATGLVALEDTVSPFHPKAVRGSAGSIFHFPVVARASASALVAACARRAVAIMATAARGESATSARLGGPLCLVIGQEAAGVPRELQRAAGATVAIPMARSVESLNAGVAGAILLYEAARQRQRDHHAA